MSDTTDRESHGDYVPDGGEFADQRRQWRESLGADTELRQQAVDLQVAAEKHSYTYQWEWAGVPVIRIPDDVMVLQELFWSYRPERIVETGVARGGSMLLNTSLMRMCGLEPAVLGIDHKVFPHTTSALAEHPLGEGVTLLEADSTSEDAVAAMRDFIDGAERVILVLDSNHTHAHVLGELEALAPLLPSGGMVLVADTLVEEFPEGHYEGRPWDRGDNPMTAVNAFVEAHDDFDRDDTWGRRALVTEFRDGILRRR